MRFGVSRLTVREAIKQLAAQGLLDKRQGKGTFVRGPSINHRKGFLYSPSEEILARNFALATEVIDARAIEADDVWAERLSIQRGEAVFFLERLRFANGVPAQLIKSYLPYRLVPGIEEVDFTVRFLYRVLEDRYRLRLKEAEEVIEAALLDDRGASLLQLESGLPVLLTRRTTYLLDDTPVEYNEILYRPNVLAYKIKLKGRDQSKIIQQQARPESGSEPGSARGGAMR